MLPSTVICDGYEQCDDGSDEANCDVCEEGSVSCRHLYTGRTICQVMCDGVTWCSRGEDEECDVVTWWQVLLALSALLLMSALLYWLQKQVIERVLFLTEEAAEDVELGELVAVVDDRRVQALMEGLVSTELQAKQRRVERTYRRVHELQDLKFVYDFATHLDSADQEDSALRLLYLCEVRLHGGRAAGADRCLLKKILFERPEIKGRIDDALSPGVIRAVFGSRSTSLLRRLKLSHVCVLLLLILRITFYYVDAIKDVFFFYALCSLSSGETDFLTLTWQLVVASGVSVALPHLLNVALFCSRLRFLPWSMDLRQQRIESNQSNLQSATLVPILVTFGPLLTALALINVARLEALTEKVLSKLTRTPATFIRREWQAEQVLREKLRAWRSLFATMRLSENSTENLVQVVLFSLLLGLRFTETGTSEAFTRIVDVPLLVALSAAWSLKTMVQTNLAATRLRKAVGAKGQVILGLYFAVSIAQRLTSVFLYFTPALGFTNVMQSWKFGQLPFVLDQAGNSSA